MSRPFRVGDRVKCVDNSFRTEHLRINGIYKVIKIRTEDKFSRLFLDNAKRVTVCHMPIRFVLVNTKPLVKEDWL